MKEIKLQTSVGHSISMTIFEPENSSGKLLLINAATGVRQYMYYSMAKFFAERGFVAITYDYYGIGASKPENLKSCNASMRSWGKVDYATVTEFIKVNYPSLRKFCLGHSVGALILGMNEDSSIFEKFVFVNTQKAYLGNLNFKTKVKAFFGFGFALPFTIRLLGYFPAPWFGLGKPLPSGVAFDWKTLILNKKSTNALLEKTVNVSKLLQQHTLVISAEDDAWVTEKGINTLMAESFPNLKAKFRVIGVSESEKNEVGHINFFRSYNSNLWEIPLIWLA